MGDLLDEVVSYFPATEVEEAEDTTSIAIVGKPNVGKSSLVNALLGYERTIVSEIAGTNPGRHRYALCSRWTILYLGGYRRHPPQKSH